MALITNNISGSSADSWRIGITGSVRIGNPGANPFPSMPGSDVDFFVSGSRGGKGTSGVSVFGGDTVISGSLTVGTGSITITSNEIQFQGGLAKIFSGSNGLVFVDSAYPSGKSLTDLVVGGGGGGGDSIFTAASNVAAFTTSSISIGRGAAASVQGADLFFYVSGSTADGSNNALFGGQIIASGALKIKDTSGAVVSSISNAGVISGSSNLLAGGNLTIAGTSALIGVVSASGDLAVNGGDLTTTATTFNLVDETATTVNFARAATSLNVGATTGNTTVRNNLIVTGDLTVNGTTTTVNTDYLIVEDPTIYLANGAASSNQNGGIAIASGSSVTAQALVWGRVANDTWGAGRLDVRTGSVSDLTSMVLLPVRASKLEVGGTSAFITSSNGSALTASVASSNPINFVFGGTSFAEILESGADAKIGASGNKNLILSGTSITMVAGVNGTIFQRDLAPIGSVTGVSSTNLTMSARTGAGAATSLVLSGSGIQLGANSTVIDFAFAGTNAGVATNASGFTLGSQAGTNLNLSGSNNFFVKHGPLGVIYQRHGISYLTVGSGSNDLSPNTAFITSSLNRLMLVGGTSQVQISGSEVFLDAGANGTTFRKDASTYLALTSPSANVVTLAAGTGYTTANLLNTVATTVNFAGAGTNISIGAITGDLYLKNATTNISGSTLIAGNSTLGSDSTDKIYFSGSAASSLIPDTNNAYDLGSPSLRWRNMYTGDLHLRNERGDWTIIEEREFLSITNNHTGRRYKFVMQEI